MAPRWDYSLSASKLNILPCPRCFWLHCKPEYKIERPRGMFPTLPGGIDRVVKDYLDMYRGGLPPQLRGKVPGALWGTRDMIQPLRHWKTGLKATIPTPNGAVGMIGALDDLLFDVTDGTYSPLDGKTKGNTPKDDGSKYNQVQADIYALLLRENGKPPSGMAYFWFVWPDHLPYDDVAGMRAGVFPIKFEGHVYALGANADRAIETITKATEILSKSRMPDASKDCEYCGYLTKRMPLEGVADSPSVVG